MNKDQLLEIFKTETDNLGWLTHGLIWILVLLALGITIFLIGYAVIRLYTRILPNLKKKKENYELYKKIIHDLELEKSEKDLLLDIGKRTQMVDPCKIILNKKNFDTDVTNYIYKILKKGYSGYYKSTFLLQLHILRKKLFN